MYLDGKMVLYGGSSWPYDDKDPIGVLDVTILSNLVLDKVLGIKDLRTDKRIDFVGGIRGLGELRRRVDSGEMKVAFALYPVSMQQLIDIADSGNIMPPKTTWFEPKLRSPCHPHTQTKCFTAWESRTVTELALQPVTEPVKVTAARQEGEDNGH